MKPYDAPTIECPECGTNGGRGYRTKGKNYTFACRWCGHMSIRPVLDEGEIRDRDEQLAARDARLAERKEGAS